MMFVHRTTVTAYTVGCVNITALECDLTRLSESAINENGKYTGRVLVQSGSEASAWVESNQINMDGDSK